MLRLFVAFAAVGVTAAVRPANGRAFNSNFRVAEAAFETFIQDFRRTYEPGSDEYSFRYSAFERNWQKIHEQNSQPESERLWTAGLNEYSDRTSEEIQALGGWRHVGGGFGSQPSALLERDANEKADSVNHIELADEVDWTHLWTSQLDQIRLQTCGNCWAEATASMMEAHLEIHRGVQKRFSAGQITQCTPNPYKCGGTGGCQGATSELAMGYLLQVSNNVTDDEFIADCQAPEDVHKTTDFSEPSAPHEWPEGIRTAAEGAFIRSIGLIAWERLPVNKYEPLLRAIYTRGPVSVAVATDWGAQIYKSGILDSCSTNPTIAHAMLAVGYGSKGGVKYWTLQNSWGTSFGENGKMRLLRKDDEETFCGQDKAPQDGTGCEGGPKEVTTCGRCGILYDCVVPHFKPITHKGVELAELRGDQF
mmetsp:Transcript_50110/g.92481  ORF Transcript_50110/g.92481 Transcript_50110/m.92481 type:complete len:421 (-) Transcript_50110:30-1292(-)